GNACRIADPLHPETETAAVPRGLAVGQEHPLAGLIQSLDEDQELDDDRVKRHPPGLAGLLGSLVSSQPDFAGIQVHVGPFEVAECRRAAGGEAEEREHHPPAGGGAGALAFLLIRRADLAAADVASVVVFALRPDGAVPEELLELVVGQRAPGVTAMAV